MSNNKTTSFLIALTIIGTITVFSILFVEYFGDYGAYINLSDLVIMLVAYLTLNPNYFMAVGLGSFFGHLLLDAPYYAIPAFVISIAEYILIIFLYKKIKRPLLQKILPIGAAILFVTISYTLVDWLNIQHDEHILISLLYHSFKALFSGTMVIMLTPLIEWFKDMMPKKTKVNE